MNREGQKGTEVHLDTLYRGIIFEHYKNPQGTTPLDRVDVAVEGYNPTCGDEVKIELKLNGRGEDAAIEGARVCVHGCTICRASGSMMYELMEEQTLGSFLPVIDCFRKMMHGAEPDEDVLEDAASLQGVASFPVRIKCALLPWTTLEEAIDEVNTNA